MKPAYLAFIILSSLTLLPGCKKEAKNGVVSPQKAVTEVTPKDHGLEAEKDLRELNRLAQAGKVKAIAASVHTQFQHWAGGITRYKQVYGFYPNIGQNYQTNADSLHLLEAQAVNQRFVMAISGRMPTGTALSPENRKALNKNAEEFVAFIREDFDHQAEFSDSSLLADKFGNKKIRVILDTDNDMVIRNVNSKDLPDEISAAATSAGIKARVIIYTKGENGAPDVVAIQQN
jgi:hypothetical protein